MGAIKGLLALIVMVGTVVAEGMSRTAGGFFRGVCNSWAFGSLFARSAFELAHAGGPRTGQTSCYRLDTFFLDFRRECADTTAT
jgi:hypothetical protein